MFCSHPFKAMGSPCELQFQASSRQHARRVQSRVVEDVARLERRYSRYRDDSLLSAINRTAASGGSISVDDETVSLLNYAVACHQQSDGLFDITSGLLRMAWRFDRNALPEKSLIEQLLPRVGWHRLGWNPPVLEFSQPGMELDFGGIVKEYAVDRAATLLQESGIRSGMVNLGGDIRIVGPRPDGGPWRVGIRHPRQPGTLLTLAVTHGAIASSGDYERCLIIDGVRYAHVLDPRTGWPVRYMAAVTVIADFCVVAGSASTIGMLKQEAGPAWLTDLGLPHLWVDVDGNCGGPLAQNG